MKVTYLGELGCRDGEVIGFDATEGKGREDGGRKECGEHFGGSVQRADEERESSGFKRPGGEAQEGGRRKAGGCDERKSVRCVLSAQVPAQPAPDPSVTVVAIPRRLSNSARYCAWRRRDSARRDNGARNSLLCPWTCSSML